MTTNYSAQEITVLKDLEPVQIRPGMYTDTTRPNHLAQEVIDNSVDEALAGFATKIEVILHPDQSIEVTDNGRGMPVDIHPTEGVSGVEVILTKLHAGGKFSNKNYEFAGGLHGVGISVVNALSERVDIQVKRNGEVYKIAFENGNKVEELEVIGTCGRRTTGTTVHFKPNPKYFDSAKFSVSRLRHLLRAKAVLCSGLEIKFIDKVNNTQDIWLYEDGLSDYLIEAVNGFETLPEKPFVGEFKGTNEAVSWALLWLPEGGELIGESYVNLIPTIQGGTHVNGLRQGLLDAIREFCEFRNLLPRGVKLTADDIWDRCSYILSLKMQDAQFAGQTKERLSSRQSAVFVSGVLKDAFSLWLNQNVQDAEKLAEIERDYDVTILWAIESGSRAWGFESPDSDFDVRFVYKHKQDFYLRLNEQRDVIELPIDDTWDVSGWDLDKTLKLLYKSNPTLFEWLQSPIVYRQTDFIERMRPLANQYFSEKKMLYHYLNTARTQMNKYLSGDKVKPKKYFYALRPILACRWIEKYHSVPPILFDDLVKELLPDEMKEHVLRLLDIKVKGAEGMEIDPIMPIQDYILANIQELDAYVQSVREEKKEWKALNQFFLEELGHD